MKRRNFVKICFLLSYKIRRKAGSKISVSRRLLLFAWNKQKKSEQVHSVVSEIFLPRVFKTVSSKTSLKLCEAMYLITS